MIVEDGGGGGVDGEHEGGVVVGGGGGGGGRVLYTPPTQWPPLLWAPTKSSYSTNISTNCRSSGTQRSDSKVVFSLTK